MSSMIMLTATNYAIWKPRMEDMLYTKDLFDPLELKGVKPADTKDVDWKKANRKTIGLIRQCVGQEVFHHIAQETDAYTLWTKMGAMYQSKTSRNKALMMRRLVNLKLRSGNTIAGHTSEFQNMVNQLASVDLKFDDEIQALFLLSSLPDDWETLVVSLSNSAPDGRLTMNMVTDALFNEEARRTEMGTSSYEGTQALVIDGRGRSQERANGSSNRGRSSSKRRSFICYYCREEGHIRRNCPKLQADKGKEKDQPAQASTVSETLKDTAFWEVDALLAATSASSAGESDWVLDSGCSVHMCIDRHSFTDYQAYDGGIVKMANDSACNIVGSGTVKYRLSNGKRVNLLDVQHVPGLRKNLISLGKIDARGCKFSAEGGVLKVLKEDREVLQARRVGDLYKLEGNVVTGGATVKHESRSTGKSQSGQGAKRSHRSTRNKRRRSRRAQVNSPAQTAGTKGVQELRLVHKEAQSNGMRSCMKSCTAPVTPMTTRISFAPNLISDGCTSVRIPAGLREVESQVARQ